jgi:hypothetical protein
MTIRLRYAHVSPPLTPEQERATREAQLQVIADGAAQVIADTRLMVAEIHRHLAALRRVLPRRPKS